jgi:hypothetical protein
MAQEGKGRGRGNRWCPHVQATWNLYRDLFFSSGRPQCTVMHIWLQKYVLLPPIIAPWGRGGGGNRWCPHMQQAWNFYGDPFVFRGGASKQSYLQKTSETTMSWSRGSIQPSLRINPIQGRTEHPFRKKNCQALRLTCKASNFHLHVKFTCLNFLTEICGLFSSKH